MLLPTYTRLIQKEAVGGDAVGGGGGAQTAAVYSYHGNLCLACEFHRDEECYKLNFKRVFLSTKHVPEI